MGHSKELGFNSEYKRKPSESVEQRRGGGFLSLGLLLLLDKNAHEGKNYRKKYIHTSSECQRGGVNQGGSGGGAARLLLYFKNVTGLLLLER